jgi:hypothetical protein
MAIDAAGFYVKEMNWKEEVSNIFDALKYLENKINILALKIFSNQEKNREEVGSKKNPDRKPIIVQKEGPVIFLNKKTKQDETHHCLLPYYTDAAFGEKYYEKFNNGRYAEISKERVKDLMKTVTENNIIGRYV